MRVLVCQEAALTRGLRSTASGTDENDDKDTEPAKKVSPKEKARATFSDNPRAQALDIKVRSGKKLTGDERKEFMGYLRIVINEM